MNPAEDCLRYLQSRNWIELTRILSDNKNAQNLADSPTFSIFENIFIDELKKHENETSDDLIHVATRIFQIHQHDKSAFTLSDNGFRGVARYLFDRNPHRVYAEILIDEPDVQLFLEKEEISIQKRIVIDQLSSNLNVKVGEHGELQFDKDIFNGSPQEKELYLAAKNVLSGSILLPNTALSTIIDSKVCSFLNDVTSNFFYKSTLDLCVVNPTTFRPELFIELDSSWHDKPKNVENDKMKDEIFQKAGLKLFRLRKKENKEMKDIFELFIKENYSRSERN
ncbi:DUF2726 domain-containing protein [Fluviicola sp.]|uniref:DUF2726 domain-containing protein n=1 Tax=Fluviicola sp. TaxID=1917219 RepID=UPI0026247A98|nr:DUF2726 domain-containing protein [Fluviicola sp.]